MSCQGCTSSCAKNTVQQPIRWEFDLGKLFRLLAILSLIGAYFVGKALNEPGWEQDIQALYPKAQIEKSKQFDQTWSVKDGEQNYWVTLSTQNSYGGPLTLATTVDQDGTIKKLDILAHKDTPAYIQKLRNAAFSRQFESKPADITPVPGKDYDIVSGATLSSNAIMKANVMASHYLAAEQFGKDPVELTEEMDLNLNHGLLALLIALVLINIKLNNKWLKTGITLSSLVVLGFMANQMISVANFSALIMGFVPSLAENPGLWLLLGAVFGGIIVLGRNIYCGNICPFHAVQFLLNKVGNINLPMHPMVRRYGRTLAKVGLWAGLFIGLLTANPTAGAYEPFGMIFSLQGEGLQWYIMPATVIGSFFIANMFCRYLCPAGEALNRLVAIRNSVVYQCKGGKK
ncbi:FMN-binding protein [Parendozoicomonas haliclonae]|uniref:Electron transport complex subunit RsxG n=1 Tax=Parendozoicomonas haliclonae TaxID=1960125 RepID=A0A1X7ALF8_9GAMM|nr:FMN-binding protein [Parendozoicomonas haliclonae]SMA48422.1 Electron transport complex subunit RsxG [Parendozoicomonas haliclonae]